MGTFEFTRLLPGQALNEARTDLLEQLAEAITRDPPRKMRWIAKLCAAGQYRRKVTF